MSKIYTKAGDGGETSTLGGKRVWKDCQTMAVVGEIDELNSSLGVAVAEMVGADFSPMKEKIII